jgi:hypothetical protein
MKSRERIRKALNLEEPDRVLIDFGQDFHNGINEVASSDCLNQSEDLSFDDRYDILSEMMLNCAVEHVHAMYV